MSTVLDNIIEQMKREKRELEERSDSYKRDNVRLKAEVQSLRTLFESAKAQAYKAVSAEANARNAAIDLIFSKLKTTLAMSSHQEHSVMEIMESHKVQKIGPNPG